jgi:ribosomal protein L44E
MDIKIIYCRKCEKETQHEIRKKVTGFERVFFGVFSLGLSEGLNESIIECRECGKKQDGD